MAEQTFAKRVLSGGAAGAAEPRAGALGERQPSALAFSLQITFKDGRRMRGFAMSHYSDYEWTDEGEFERLIILFGMRAITIEGELLCGVVRLLSDGRLTEIQEMTHREVLELKRDNPDGKPVITRVMTEPDINVILNAIRGEEEDETRYPRRVK